jgi:hypothetical protein
MTNKSVPGHCFTALCQVLKYPDAPRKILGRSNADGEDADYPTALDGLNGMAFLDAERSGLLLVVLAQHGEKLEFCGFRQKFIVPLEPGLLIRQFQMNVEILPGSPILVEIEYVGIIIANVKMIVDAAGLGSRAINETAQQFKKFCTFSRSSVQRSCEGATWFHNFWVLTFDHGRDVHAIWIFNNQCESTSVPELVNVSEFAKRCSKRINREW